MPRLILLLAISAVLYISLRRIASLPPQKRRGEYFKLGLGVAVVAVVLLTLAGKMHWIGAALTGLLVAARQAMPLLLRFFPLLGALGSKAAAAGSAAPQRSTVSTGVLRMHLEHESGKLSGEVLDGPFKGWLLDDLSREQLGSLASYCRSNDSEALQLLEGYLEQRFPNEPESERSADAPPEPGGMTRGEALEVLGLDESADRDAIITAHRKLMQRLHPDRGGSDYLAAKINQAKDLLLQS